jgi:hypothetical protein
MLNGQGRRWRRRLFTAITTRTGHHYLSRPHPAMTEPQAVSPVAASTRAGAVRGAPSAGSSSGDRSRRVAMARRRAPTAMIIPVMITADGPAAV